MNEKTYPTILQQHRGRVVLVNFWATWCEPCRDEMPALAKLRTKATIDLITVSADEPEHEADAARFLSAAGVRFPAWIKRPASDDAFIASVDPKWTGALPALFLYDRSGRLQRSFIGDTNIAELETAIRKLL